MAARIRCPIPQHTTVHGDGGRYLVRRIFPSLGHDMWALYAPDGPWPGVPLHRHRDRLAVELVAVELATAPARAVDR